MKKDETREREKILNGVSTVIVKRMKDGISGLSSYRAKICGRIVIEM